MSNLYTGQAPINTGAKPYNITNQPSPISPVSLADFKLWAKIPGSTEDNLLQVILNGVTLAAEKYTHRFFLSRELETFRDYFGDIDESPTPFYRGLQNCPIVLRRSPIDLTFAPTIEYVTNGVLTPFTDFQVAQKADYSQLWPSEGKSWPCPDSGVVYPITIKFKAGYGDTGATTPEDIKNALLAHATWVYVNRGDCSDMSSACSCKFAPAESIAVYNQYRILEFRAF